MQWDQRSIADATLPQALAGSEIDQSIYEDEHAYDQTPYYGSDTPLGQWVIQANRWDGVDPAPP